MLCFVQGFEGKGRDGSKEPKLQTVKNRLLRKSRYVEIEQRPDNVTLDFEQLESVMKEVVSCANSWRILMKKKYLVCVLINWLI